VRLKTDEQDMLEGKQGPIRQKAMELLVKYGTALGAEEFVDVDNVFILSGLFAYTDVFKQPIDIDDIASEYFMDSQERLVVDSVKAYTTNHLFTIDLANGHADLVRAPRILQELIAATQQYCKRIGVSVTGTCTPYQCGSAPVYGEHIAWVESSAISFANAVLGARTNIEGLESSFSAALTGKTPLWGFHLDENRKGTTLVQIDEKAIDLGSVMEYELMGCHVGRSIGTEIPIYPRGRRHPNADMLKGLCATGASCGGIEMYHMVGVTPEAHTLEEATGGRSPAHTVQYGAQERRQCYDRLNTSRRDHVDVVAIGCPHYSIRQMAELARLLEGKTVNENTLLLVYTAKSIETVASRSGYTDTIEGAGGHILLDSCPINIYFPTSSVVATDAAKITYYMTGLRGYENVWYGSMKDCVDAAITGQWRGELK
jgi:predicted aconitase